jgi:hypothetical protein
MYRSTYKKMMDSSQPSSNSKPEKSGKKWTKEEDDQLTTLVENKTPYDEISKQHGRTETAVKMRAINNAIYKLTDADSEKIAEAVNLPIEIIDEFFKNKQDWKDKKDSEKETKEKKEKKKEEKIDDKKDNTRILIKFKMFLKKKGEFTDKLDELFDEFMCIDE